VSEEVVDNNAYHVVIAFDVKVDSGVYVIGVATAVTLSAAIPMAMTMTASRIVVVFPPGNTLPTVLETVLGELRTSCFA